MYEGVISVEITDDDPEEMGNVFVDHVMAYARSNMRAIQKYGLPALYDTDVRWERTFPYVAAMCDGNVCAKPEKVDLWRCIRRVYAEKKGDCKDLVAIRLAERWLMGDLDARPEYIRYPDALGEGYDLFHLVLRHGDGTLEDPSEYLGMLYVA